MFLKLFAIGFIMDPRTIRQVKHTTLATILDEPVPYEDSRDFLNKVANNDGIKSLKDILEKKTMDNEKNLFKSGRDERYDVLYNETSRNELIFNITKFVYQMNLLRKLESNHVSVIEKVGAIEQYEKDTSDKGYIVQLKSGGFWKDWNIDL